MAEDSCASGVLVEINQKLLEQMNLEGKGNKPLLICSGGTTTRCAANGHLTLDLRNKYTKIIYRTKDQTIDIGGGVNMGALIKELSKYSRSFPIGLSGQPGFGYVLSGGISPISRSQGLAIDHIKRIKGFWGSGKSLNISKPNLFSNEEHKREWKGLCGAAAFLGIVTELTLETQKLYPLNIWQANLNPNQLATCIYQAEKWPNSASFHWIWGDYIKAYVIIEKNEEISQEVINQIISKLPSTEIYKESNVLGLNKLPPLELPKIIKRDVDRIYSEVIGLIGPDWNSKTQEIVNTIKRLIEKRPNNSCYIAAQQLGGISSVESQYKTAFLHRNCSWKPWINAAWKAGDQDDREKAIRWQQKAWDELKPVCPGIHLAQMHHHLNSHHKELISAYRSFLPELRNLKSIYDPNGILPSL
tara:strand:+ start:1400 stop:2647 length:1248 start_codon:yes stop_codon:yes gene_type:complete